MFNVFKILLFFVPGALPQGSPPKNKPIGNSAHARRQKGGVPEEAEIGRTLTSF